MLLLLFGALAALRTAEGQSTFELTAASDGAVGVSGASENFVGPLSAEGQGVHGVAGAAASTVSADAAGEVSHGTAAAGASSLALVGDGTAAIGASGQGVGVFSVVGQGTAVFMPEPVVGAGASSVSVASAGSAEHTRLPVVGAGEGQIGSPVGAAIAIHAIGAAGAAVFGLTSYARAITIERDRERAGRRPVTATPVSDRRVAAVAARRRLERPVDERRTLPAARRR